MARRKKVDTKVEVKTSVTLRGRPKKNVETNISENVTKKKPPKKAIKKAPARKKVAEPKRLTPKFDQDAINEIIIGNINLIDTKTATVTNSEDTLVKNEKSNVDQESEKAMESENIEADSETCEIIEKFDTLEVQDVSGVNEELIEFDSVDNVITVEYADPDNASGDDSTLYGKVEELTETVIDTNENENIAISMESSNNGSTETTVKEPKRNLSFEKFEEENKIKYLSLDCSQNDNSSHGSNNSFDTDSIQIENKINTVEQSNTEKIVEKVVESLENTSMNKTEEMEPNTKNLLLKDKDYDSSSETSVKSSDTKKKTPTDTTKPKNKPTKKTPPKKIKPQKKPIVKKKGTKLEESDESLIRRSSRIKSISVLKKPSVGHGLVKSKSESELSETSNDSEKMAPPGPANIPSESSDKIREKPIKVKSRWRRSSELEMNVKGGDIKVPENNENINKNEISGKDAVVEARLKQFVHLKENLYLTARLVCKEAKKMTCDCFLTEEEKKRGEMACGEDCLNRLLMIECGNLCQVSDRCANKKFQKGQFAPVEVFNTNKKGLGLRAAANIPYGEFILEYVGEVLNSDEFEKRAEEYSKVKNLHYYFMSLRSDAVIDATVKGNISRFINHSCDPNAETQKWTVNGELRIGFFSTRTILAGEEITFDYQFERYGKEAQKCFCEAPTCRGWLGEEPTEDSEEEDEEEEEEEEEEVEEIELHLPKNISEIEFIEKDKENEEIKTEGDKLDDIVPTEISKEPEKIPPKTKIKKKALRKKIRKEFEELDKLDEEIEMLVTTGLKNQAHTLKLSRLMLRASDPNQRSKLMRVLRKGELPCRRLFLDYHGLRLLHGYMTDTQHLCNIDKKYEPLRLEIVQTLAVLPIPNKTMLQDSKVLPTIEKWSSATDNSSPVDSEGDSPNNEPEEPLIKEIKEEVEIKIKTEDLETEKYELLRKSVGMEEVNFDCFNYNDKKGAALAEEIINIFEDDSYVPLPKPKEKVQVKVPERNYLEEIISLSLQLLEKWSNLKEVFKIPKKERIEQMKEHERQANKGFNGGLGLEQYAEKRNESRYRGLQRVRPMESSVSKKRLDDRNAFNPLSKYKRRQLFAMQVEQQEEERRRKQREMWQQHEQNCMMLGTDPRFTAPFDPSRGYQCIWNPQIGQWQNYPIPPQNQPPPLFPNSLPNTNLPPPNANIPFGLLSAPNRLPPPLPAPLPNLSQIPPPLSNPVPMQMAYQQIPPSPIPFQQQTPLPNYKDQTKIEYGQIGDVKFMGPIPPSPKLPPKWKCAKDKYGRPYYYHIRLRKSQWEPPPFEQPSAIAANDSSESSSSESSSSESSSSSEGSESDDDMNDSRLLRQVRKQMDKQSKHPIKLKDDVLSSVGKHTPVAESSKIEEESSIERRLREQFNLLKEDTPPPSKRKKSLLVQEIIISPRSEEDKLQFKEDLKRYKENKEKLRKQKELILKQTKKHLREKKLMEKDEDLQKARLREMKYSNTEESRKIKEAFRAAMANTVVNTLNFYRRPECKEGKIVNTEDFKHLARKLTHFVMLKEMKHISSLEELMCTDSVKAKAREYIKKYMSKFGEVYQKRDDEPDHYY